MDEKKKENTIVPAENNEAGNTSEETGLIDKAHAAAERLERANKETDELVVRQEKLQARAALAGKSIFVQPAVKPEISPEQYSEALLKGVILD